jgi:hypothetical protein
MLDKICHSLELLFVVLALYLTAYTIHQSRDISLETQEHNLVPEINALRHPESTMNSPSFDAAVRSYESARWALRVKDKLRDNWLMHFFMHGYTDRRPASERQLLELNVNLSLSHLQQRFTEALPFEIQRILEVQDNGEAGRQLEWLVLAGYYSQSFKSWSDAAARLEALVGDKAKQDRIRKILATVEATRPFR